MLASISSVESMGTGVETYLGAPENPFPGRRSRSQQTTEATEEEQAARVKYQEEPMVGCRKRGEELQGILPAVSELAIYRYLSLVWLNE